MLTAVEGRMLKGAEVRSKLGIGRDKLRQLTQAGEFPRAYRTGEAPNSPWRYPEEDVAAYLNRQFTKRVAS